MMLARLPHRFRSFLPIAACCLALAGTAGIARGQATNSAPASGPATKKPTNLAGRVPADAALYVEIRGLNRILGTSTGAGMASTVVQVVRSAATSAPAEAAPAGTAPASVPAASVPAASVPAAEKGDSGPRQLFASAVGLKEDSKVIEMLFSGPVAIAADGWSGLSDAILLASPSDPAALETLLVPQRRGEAGKVRRYTLGYGHELACDGQTVVVGRWKRTSLYSRTIELLGGNGAASLGDASEFRERTASLSSDAQVIGFMGPGGAATAEGQNPLTAWWPDDWPRIKTLAFGLVWGARGAYVKCSARLDAEGPQLTRSEPPIQVLRRLPESVVSAWTHAIDYIGHYRRLRSKLSQEPEGFHFDSLEAGLEPGIIEKRVLSHLVGDTVLVIDQVSVQPKDVGEASEPLALPMGAILVETDDPDAVAGALPLIAGNLVKLLNSQAGANHAVAIHQETLGQGGPVIYSIPIGIPQTGKTRCDLLQALELSWTVADRWLIVGTHPLTVRRLVEARRGVNPPLGITDLDQVVEQVAERGGQPRRVLFAQPRAGAAMIETWTQHIAKHHPEMLQAQWWDRILRRQRAMGKQVGILGRADHGTVEVVDALPNGPARGRLAPGDRILAVDGVKIDPASPLQSLRQYVAERGQPGQVSFLVRRGAEEKEILLPMPKEEIDGGLRSPVELLKRVSDVCRVFGSASYVLWQPKPDVVDVRVDLQYIASPAPRQRARGTAPVPASAPAPAAQPVPQSQPAVKPASAPAANVPASVPAVPASLPATQPGK